MQAQNYSRQQYSTKHFWQSRYKESPTSYFDWYAEFPQLKQTFQSIYNIQKSNKILMLGCGNSKLSQQMYEEGYQNIVNIDISQSVIQQMKKICDGKGYTKMKWVVMDATEMGFQQGEFDVVIDKGTLDALISGKNIDICNKMLKQSMRVLKKQGQFILITYGSPQGRKRFFQNSIGLHSYDYYFTRVDLSSMSTLINLMRSNLGNKPLNAITKDTQALKKSLLEFNLIKVLRRNRKNQKKYIIWNQFVHAKEENEDTESPKKVKDSGENEGKDSRKLGQQGKETSEKKQEVQGNNTSEKEQKKQVNNKQEQGQKSKTQQITYNPKKQSFCYVYSISQKFAINLPQIIKTISISQQYPTEQDPFQPNTLPSHTQTLISIYPTTPQLRDSILKSVYYLQKQQIQYGELRVYRTLDKFKEDNKKIESKSAIKVILREGKKNVVYVYEKMVWEVQVQGEIGEVEGKMKQFGRMLVEEAGLDAHPDPRNYAYLGILLQKLQYKMKYNQFLQKYWYPTHKLTSSSSSSSSSTHTYHLSLSPTLPAPIFHSLLPKFFPKCKTAPKLLNPGYINFIDPKLLTLINFCSMTYCQGENIQIVFKDYNIDDGKINGRCMEGVDVPVVELKEGKVEIMVARIFSAL